MDMYELNDVVVPGAVEFAGTYHGMPRGHGYYYFGRDHAWHGPYASREAAETAFSRS